MKEVSDVVQSKVNEIAGLLLVKGIALPGK
jgi:hypothetical protein